MRLLNLYRMNRAAGLLAAALLLAWPAPARKPAPGDGPACPDVFYRICKLLTHFIRHDFSDTFNVTAEAKAVVLNFYISDLGYGQKQRKSFSAYLKKSLPNVKRIRKFNPP